MARARQLGASVALGSVTARTLRDQGRVARPVLLAEESLVELAVVAAGEFLHEVDRSRALEPGQTRPAVLGELGLELGAGCARLDELDDGLHGLTHLVVRD